MNWNFNMAEAPQAEKTGKGRSAVRGEWCLISIIDKGIPKVIASYRTDYGTWAGCAKNTNVYAWQMMPVPAPIDFGIDVAATDARTPIADDEEGEGW